MDDTLYRTVRFFQDGQRQPLEKDLTLDEAQAHCKDPDTSSSTTTDPALIALTAQRGPWFDGYERQ